VALVDEITPLLITFSDTYDIERTLAKAATVQAA
jgi:hypothetical protein